MKKIVILLVMLLLLVSCSRDVKSEKEEPIEEGTTMSQLVESQNERGETELLIAVHNNDVEVAKELIDQGANVNIQDNISDSPYLYAGAQGRTAILEYMIKNADIDHSVYNRFGGNAIIPAAEKGHLDAVKLLVNVDGEEIDHQNNFGYTALIEAVALTDGSEVFQEIVQVLVDAGANKGLKDNNGKTALDYAIDYGYEEMIKILK